MVKTNWYFLLLIFVIGSGCKSDDFDLSAGCAILAQANSELFNDAPADSHTIDNVQLVGDCIFIEFSAGGCSGDTWEVNLYGSESVLFSEPPQRSIRLSLLDTEECEAAITQSVSFDVSAFKVLGSDVMLNLTGYDELIEYPN